MDELTAERFGPGVPSAEARRRPRPLKRVVEVPPEVIEQRRAILNGDFEEQSPALVAMAEHRRLAQVIRTWVA